MMENWVIVAMKSHVHLSEEYSKSIEHKRSLLLPCPFCGGRASCEKVEYEDIANTFSVGCSTCDIHWEDTSFEELMNAWNRRAGLTSDVKEMERLRKRVKELEDDLKTRIEMKTN